LLALNGVEEALADQLFSRNILSTAMLANAAIEDLTVLRAIGDEQAVYLIQSARKSLGMDPDAPIEEKRAVDKEVEQELDQEAEKVTAVESQTVTEQTAEDTSEAASEDVVAEDGDESEPQK
jgi:hydroxylamine reductase (hybrid-cluster protein)